MVQPLVIWPDEKLRTVCEPVQQITQDTLEFAKQLRQTVMYHQGLGLAAPQVGVTSRIFVLNYNHILSETPASNEQRAQQPFALINPTIEQIDDTYMYSWNEGCLSVPGYFEKRSRPQRIVVSYYDDNGKHVQTELQGLPAFVFQHEYDHLQGKVFVDDLSDFKQQRVKKKIAKTLRSNR